MDIVIENETYQQVGVVIMKNLCIALLLGGDFQSQHKRVVFQYNGFRADLFVPKINHLNVMSESGIKPASLFNNLLSDCHPVATKSRRFNAADQKFIDAEGNRLHSAGIIRPSVSPWRVQILVVNNKESGKKRLCVDYTQTVNLFTRLDEYPLPCIDNLVNKLSASRVLSTFDLKSAYHQILILESDKRYTAFEAEGKLWEFNQIPLGVTNGVPQFQRKMDEIVEIDKLKDTFPYLENVTVGEMNQEEHDANVSAFLDAL